MKQVDTASRIMLAAHTLFAKHGFAETTMRQITAQASVNLAAVNYHYGSKNGLIQAVADQLLEPLFTRMEAMLETRQHAKDEKGTEELLHIMVTALSECEVDNPSSLSLLMRMLDLAYTPSQAELRAHLLNRYGDRLQYLIQQLKMDSSKVDDEEFFWRMHFLLGSLIFTLSNHAALNDYYRDGSQETLKRTLHRLIPVFSAGLQAPAYDFKALESR